MCVCICVCVTSLPTHQYTHTHKHTSTPSITTTILRLQLANYNAALLSITFMVLLGFADDVLDCEAGVTFSACSLSLRFHPLPSPSYLAVPWRYKMLLPTVASLPLLVTYSGGTDVLIPAPLRPLLADAVSVGVCGALSSKT